MNKKPIENARDADLRLSKPALQRAAQRARVIAQQTGTAIVISRNGVIEQIKMQTTSSGLVVRQTKTPYGDKE